MPSLPSRDDSSCLSLIEKELSGGKISKARIDTFADFRAQGLAISGLRQDTLEYLVDRYGARIRHLWLFKCPQIRSFEPLEALTDIVSLTIFWNQKAERLWNIGANEKLVSLEFENINRVQDLTELASATRLRLLAFGNAAVGKTQVDSLEPIGSISTLEELSFNPWRVADNRVSPILRLKKLRELSFSNRLFTTEKIAWLKAHLPIDFKSPVLAPFRRLSENVGRRDIMVIGRRKPFLNSKTDVDRLQAYTSRFEQLVAKYRADPSLPEPK